METVSAGLCGWTGFGVWVRVCRFEWRLGEFVGNKEVGICPVLGGDPHFCPRERISGIPGFYLASLNDMPLTLREAVIFCERIFQRHGIIETGKEPVECWLEYSSTGDLKYCP